MACRKFVAGRQDKAYYAELGENIKTDSTAGSTARDGYYDNGELTSNRCR